MSIDLYNEAFGFSERPFTLLPDPSFLYWSPAHTRAFTILEYGLMTRAPLTVITGEVGTGKTTLVRALLDSLEDDIAVGLISNAHGGRGDLMRWVLNALDIPTPPNADYVALFQTFQDNVINTYADGRRTVLVIDEAQNLPMELLEELRMLTNINSGKDELLQLILVGQPELRDMIARPELRQFAQRVTATYHISPMDQRTTRDYIHHRLVHVGGTGAEFSPQAIKMIFEYSGGIPRIVNKLCDLGLVYAVSAGTTQVGLTVVKELIRDGLLIKVHTGSDTDTQTPADTAPTPKSAPAPQGAQNTPAPHSAQTANGTAPNRPAPDTPAPVPGTYANPPCPDAISLTPVPASRPQRPASVTDIKTTRTPGTQKLEPLYLTNRIDIPGKAAE